MTSRTKIALAVLSAAAVGTIIGLLTAPENGKQTRNRLGKTTGKWVDNMGRIFTRNKHAVESKARTLQPEIV